MTASQVRHRETVPPSSTPDPSAEPNRSGNGDGGLTCRQSRRAAKNWTRERTCFPFGLVLYEMATGHRAFEGDTGPALHNAILTQTPVPVRQLNPNFPPNSGTSSARHSKRIATPATRPFRGDARSTWRLWNEGRPARCAIACGH